jgi:aspartyl-tRNA(Asn)/glutamyl-tRNA(Gln) amidotransferase subunit B
MDFETVIGLEVHCQLLTNTKIFCNSKNEFGGIPNNHTCPVCLGMPGVLPVLNETAFRMGIKIGLALNCEINPVSIFARKHYFYPDLPKNFQTSQYELPLAEHGYLDIPLDGKIKRIGITRGHMEEDAGKLVHAEDSGLGGESLVDLNRTGTPLLEIVSEPEMRSPAEAKAYLQTLRDILLYLEVSDCNMEEGSFRCDANISIRPFGQEELGVKTELKNMNSFRYIEKALEYEEDRQRRVLARGEEIIQETRLWDVNKGITIGMRTKESAHDYRYFPEPDLPPFMVSEEMLAEIRAELPELPKARRERFVSQYGLSEYDAEVLTSDKALADYFEETAGIHNDPKAICNWVQTELLRELKEASLDITDSKLTPIMLAEMLKLIDNNTISGKIAKDVFILMFKSGKNAQSIVKDKCLEQITDRSSIDSVVADVISENPEPVESYKAGKTAALGFLVGQVMKKTKGKANPKLVNELFREKLD